MSLGWRSTTGTARNGSELDSWVYVRRTLESRDAQETSEGSLRRARGCTATQTLAAALSPLSLAHSSSPTRTASSSLSCSLYAASNDAGRAKMAMSAMRGRSTVAGRQ